MKDFHDLKEYQGLLDLGLTEKEAIVYLSALETGGGTITDLADHGGIERTGIYYHLQKLLEMKLIKMVYRGKRAFYLPSDPDRLKQILDQKNKRFEEILPAMQERFSKEVSKSIIKYYEGEDEVDTFYDAVYRLLEKIENTEHNQIYIFGTSFQTAIEANKDLLKFTSPDRQINISSKAILPAAQKIKNPAGLEGHPYIITRYNLPPSQLKHVGDRYAYPGSTVVFQDHIILFDWRNLIFSITENKNNAATWRAFFELVWDNIK